MTGILHGLHSLTIQHLGTLTAHRTAGKTCLAETTATDTATEYFQIRSVMDDLGRRHNGLDGPIGIIQILNDPLCNHLGRSLTGSDSTQGAIFIISRCIERRYVHTGNFRNFQKELLFCPIFSLCTIVQSHDLHGALFTLTQREKVNIIRQRLGIIGTNTTGKNNIMQAMTIFGMQRHARKVQHVQNIGIAHFVTNGKSDHIKFFYRATAFQCPQGQIILAHSRFHIAPGRKNALTPDTVHLIHYAIEDPHAQIGHTDLIGIREAERNIDPNRIRIFLYFIKFTAGITGRFLHRWQHSVEQIRHRITSKTVIGLLYP